MMIVISHKTESLRLRPIELIASESVRLSPGAIVGQHKLSSFDYEFTVCRNVELAN